jgi:hypothetical protein
MGYECEGYGQLYSAPYRLGESVHDGIAEYRKRSRWHYFNRMDTSLAIQSRKEVYLLLAKYLHPDRLTP